MKINEDMKKWLIRSAIITAFGLFLLTIGLGASASVGTGNDAINMTVGDWPGNLFDAFKDIRSMKWGPGWSSMSGLWSLVQTAIAGFSFVVIGLIVGAVSMWGFSEPKSENNDKK